MSKIQVIRIYVAELPVFLLAYSFLFVSLNFVNNLSQKGHYFLSIFHYFFKASVYYISIPNIKTFLHQSFSSQMKDTKNRSTPNDRFFCCLYKWHN